MAAKDPGNDVAKETSKTSTPPTPAAGAPKMSGPPQPKPGMTPPKPKPGAKKKEEEAEEKESKTAEAEKKSKKKGAPSIENPIAKAMMDMFNGGVAAYKKLSETTKPFRDFVKQTFITNPIKNAFSKKEEPKAPDTQKPPETNTSTESKTASPPEAKEPAKEAPKEAPAPEAPAPMAQEEKEAPPQVDMKAPAGGANEEPQMQPPAAAGNEGPQMQPPAAEQPEPDNNPELRH